MTSYEEFKAKAKAKGHKLTKQEFYRQLVIHKQSILQHIQETNQGVVAKALGMHISTLSTLTALLKLPIVLVTEKEPQHDNNTTEL